MGKPGAGGEETKGEVSFTGNPFKPLVHSQPMITNEKTPNNPKYPIDPFLCYALA